ncbi:MAG: S41 family peptidase, partial [Bacteroidota bacterium]
MRFLQLMTSLLLALSVLCIQAQTSEDNPLVHYPSVSPDGKTLAFSYQGDLWTMELPEGTPRRLTLHEAYESYPKWSKDGKMLAFSGSRLGNNDIFTISAMGGTVKRLTYHFANDAIGGWTPDNQILFETSRSYQAVEWDNEVHSVSANGGTPVRAMDALGYMPVASPSGRFVAFVKGACRISREDYNGPANKDIWLFDTKEGKYTQLTKNEAQDIYPVWGKDDQTLFFLSARNGRYNVHKLGLSTSGSVQLEPQALTTFKDMGIRYLEGNGETLVFERGDEIYTMPTSGGTPKAIKIELSAGDRFDDYEHKTYSANAESYSISPNEELVAVEIHGEIFVKKNDKEKTRAVNRSNHPYRDVLVYWLNDSSLLYLSDRGGNYDLYLTRSTDTERGDLFRTLKTETLQLTNTKVDETNLEISPDGKKIALQRGRGQLVVADIDKDGKLSNEKVLLDGWAEPSGVTWSPDSRWLAYSLEDLDFNSDVYIHAADNSKEPVNVSMHPRGDYQPNWSRDGSKLAFVSSRNNGDNDVWFVWLKEEDWEKTKRDWEENEDEEKEKPKKEEKKEGEEGEDEGEEPMQIDFDKIYYRLTQATSMSGEEYNPVFTEDGEKIYFTAADPTNGSRALYEVKWDGSEIKQLTGGRPAGLTLSPNGKSLYLAKGGRLGKLSGGKVEMFSHSAKMTLDFVEEKKQIFAEASKTITEAFYDPQFHGYDWEKLKKTYEPIVMKASTKADFRNMFNWMLGQLNASHMGLYGGSDQVDTQRESTGLLGIETKSTKKGAQITYIIPDSPADKIASKLNVGETILSINGQKLSANDNLYAHLTNTATDEILLEVEGTDGKSREVIIRPARSLRSEKYEAWVDSRRKLVDQYSGGKLGYIHIQGMNWPSFERFERELTASGMGKEGLVIDVRFNGGGWTTDYLMTVLSVQQHAYTVPRGATDNLEANQKKFKEYYPYGERLPLSAWTKPAIALCNPNSYSNAEIFSHAFKTLNRGKLVGEPTFGAVIST